MKNFVIKLFLFVIVGLMFSFCKRNGDNAISPENPNEQEQITTLHLILKEGSTVIDTFTFRDIDGPGGNPPAIETINLLANKSYSAQLILLDESKIPVENISTGVEEERNEHQFFYTPSTAALTIAYSDQDDYGVPLGLSMLWNTGAADSGSLRIVLKHQPNVKPKTGAGNSLLGDTDLDVSMPLVVVN